MLLSAGGIIVQAARRPGRPSLAIVIAALACGAAEARGFDACPGVFAGGEAPALVNPKLAAETAPLCYDAFAVLHSGTSRTPLYAAERLTRASVAAARAVDRIDAFHEEERLPSRSRAALSDYVRSGFDRGHMAPAGDMPTPEAQAQSFSLANVVPQDRSLNRHLWSGIEESVRRLATRRGELFVVTGPIFSGRSVASIGEGVLVPAQIYKAVYDPARGEAAAYLVPNDDSRAWRIVPVAELAESAGIDPFPGLTGRARSTAMRLPKPLDDGHGSARDGSGRDSWGAWLRHELYLLLKRLWRDIMRSIF